MATSPNTPPQGSIMGIIQVLLLGTLAVSCALLAALIYTLRLGDATLISLANTALPVHTAPWFGGALWTLELIAYVLLAWIISRNIIVGLTGIVLGVFTRFLFSGLIAILLASSLGGTFSATLLQMHNELWLFRLLAVLAVLLAFAWPYRALLRQGYGLLVEEKITRPAVPPRSFAFTSTAASTGQYKLRPAVDSAATSGQLEPPEGVQPVMSANNVSGTVTIPARVVLDSIPDAMNVLPVDRPVLVRLAFIVPQLTRATVWLRWEHLFPGGPDDLNPLPKADLAVSLRDRWIRIPAKYYIRQVPPEYFEFKKKPPAWLSLPKVPQEDQFETAGTAGGSHGIS